MHINLTYSIISSVFLFCSCSQKKDLLNEFEATYKINKSELNINPEHITSYGKMLLFEEEGFILKEEFKSDYLMQKIYLKKDSISPLLKIGNGPNEYTKIKLSQKNKNNTFWTIDMAKRNLVNMDLSGNVIKEVKFPRTIFNAINFDSQFIISGYTEDIEKSKNSRFSILDSSGYKVKDFGIFPDDKIETSNYTKLFAYQGNIAGNSINKRIAFATRFGAILDIYEINNNVIKLITNKHYYYASYEDKTKSNMTGVNYNKDNKFGFIDICSTPDYIYTIYSGKDFETFPNKDIDYLMSGNIILVYDWSGNPVCRLETNSNLMNICVDEKNTILIGLSCDDDYKIYSFNLSHIKELKQ